MKTLVIDRERWLRGMFGDSPSFLLNGRGKMCCLGFFSLSCGVEPAEMQSKEAPRAMLEALPLDRAKELKPRFAGLIKKRSPGDRPQMTQLCYAMMRTNDDPEVTDSKREPMLKKMFARIRWKVRFVDTAKASSVPERSRKHTASPGKPKS